MRTRFVIIFLTVYLCHVEIAKAQNCSQNFDAKYWYDHLEVKVNGDFPNCDSCFLTIVNRGSNIVNNQFQVKHFVMDYFQSKKYLFSSVHPNANFTESDKLHLNDLLPGDFIRITDIYVSCINCKEECIVVLPSIFIQINSREKKTK